jgi:hypothetical protein
MVFVTDSRVTFGLVHFLNAPGLFYGMPNVWKTAITNVDLHVAAWSEGGRFHGKYDF